jgi:hypothetical protein
MNTTAFFVAFGGPVLLGVIGFVITELMHPRRRRGTATRNDEALKATLIDAERAARQAADGIARVREQMAIGARH